ncbi:MAG: hypothetical protein EOO54_08405 [Haliea sp.]|nr:MAG: hypothetical protein EOO54_08405 [Haliea sp.]
MDTTPARVMLLAIGYQESAFLHRRQMGNGPARGFWQFERGGGVVGVLNHPASADLASHLCDVRRVPLVSEAVHAALETDDVLAVGFARLLLWTDRGPLPGVYDADDAWAYYLRNWRPGKPHPDKWAANHAKACELLGL